MIRLRNALVLMLLALAPLGACNTVDGIGKDFQELGRSLGL
jgi:predicted small secreted protein